MKSVGAELALVAIAAAFSPTTLTFSVLALVLGDKPRRTGFFFYAGAMSATLAIGVVAAFVLGNVAAPSQMSPPKTWVLILDIVLGVLGLIYVVRMVRKPADPKQIEGMVNKMSGLASSPAIAIVGAGAALANPGGFIPIALKDISQLNVSTPVFIAYWVAFSLVALLPLLLALIALTFSPGPTNRLLTGARGWLERNVRLIAAVLIFVLCVVLLRNGISGLANK